MLEFAALVFYGDKIGFQIDPVYVYDNYLQLAVAATFVSLLLSIFLYAYSFRDGAMLAAGGNTGMLWYFAECPVVPRDVCNKKITL